MLYINIKLKKKCKKKKYLTTPLIERCRFFLTFFSLIIIIISSLSRCGDRESFTDKCTPRDEFVRLG